MISSQTLFAECTLDQATFKMGNSMAAFDIELVDTNETRAKGLMFREELARFAGMLFIYEQSQSVSFWMRNTLIPLDMIFMDQTGLVVNVHSNAIPMDETSIFGGDNILAVLEVNGGLAVKLGIQAGARLQHPAFDQDIAAWPCKN